MATLNTAAVGYLSKLHLLMLHGYWPTVANPATTFAVEQVAALTRLGCRVTLIVPRTLARFGSPPLPIIAVGLDPTLVILVRFISVRLPEGLSVWPGGIEFNTWSAGKAARFWISRLRRIYGPFDACIIHGARYFGWALPAWRHLVNGRVAVVIHGVEPFLEKPAIVQRARRLLARAANAMDFCVVVGRPLISHVVALGMPASRVQVVWNGTVLPDLAEVSDHQRALDQPRRIVSVSRLIAVKGVDHNLRALAELAIRRPDLSWRYQVVGDGVERPGLEQLTRDLGLQDRVRFMGMLNHEQAMQAIADADIFSLPSWAEAFGLVYLEAMARMRPVIGCVGQGAAEVFRDGEEGLLVPPHDINALAVALEKLIASPATCQLLGRTGRKQAEAFTWDANVRRLLTLLDLISAEA